MRHHTYPIRFVLSVCLVFAGAGHAAGRGGLPDFSGLVERVSPAVVNISTTQRTVAGILDRQGYQGALEDDGQSEDGMAPPEPGYFDATSLGSGFIISSDGHILTNYHVVRGAAEVIVKLSDRRQLPAKVLGVDPPSDLALVKIEARDLPVADISPAGELKVGEWVLAIGSPFGFDHSVTVGIVSAKGRSVGTEQYVPFIQTDVAINPGNSGGPLFNLDGEVVGINSQIYSRTGGFMGVSFAIPIDLAMEVVEQLKTSGRVSRGWLGVNVQDVTRELAESFKMSRPEGALVRGVQHDSPASRAGIRIGDIILKFDGEAVHTAGDLPPLVGRGMAGRLMPLTVLRNGTAVALEVMLGELPVKEEAAEAAIFPDEQLDRIGLLARDLRLEERRLLDVGEGGVLVERVAQGPAHQAGLRPGDVILMVDQTRVTGLAQFDRLIDDLPVGKAVAILIQRQGGSLFLPLRLDGR